MRSTLRLCFLLLSVASGSAAQRVDVPTCGATSPGPTVVLSNADGQNAYSGVVRIESRATRTGVFIVPTQASTVAASAPASVLTNGHCPAFPSCTRP